MRCDHGKEKIIRRKKMAKKDFQWREKMKEEIQTVIIRNKL